LYLARRAAKPPPVLRAARGNSRDPRASGCGCVALNLKWGAAASDRRGMADSAASARPRSSAPPLALRRSLNTPVLSIPELPVGPATAFIATQTASATGAARHTLAVRCERTREVALFPIRSTWPGRADSELGADAALSLAEGMGFLFEENAPAIAGGAAESIWRELVDALDPRAVEAALGVSPVLTKFRRANAAPPPQPASKP
jgi:hypothetical protein